MKPAPFPPPTFLLLRIPHASGGPDQQEVAAILLYNAAMADHMLSLQCSDEDDKTRWRLQRSALDLLERTHEVLCQPSRSPHYDPEREARLLQIEALMLYGMVPLMKACGDEHYADECMFRLHRMVQCPVFCDDRES